MAATMPKSDSRIDQLKRAFSQSTIDLQTQASTMSARFLSQVKKEST